MIYHVVWATHNSRISQRMIDYKVLVNNNGVNAAVILKEEEMQIIDALIRKEANELSATVHALNVLSDHVHMLIECKKNKLSSVIGQIKGYSAREFNKLFRINEYENNPHRYYDGTIIKLWVRRFSRTVIESEEQLANTYDYIVYNKEKHGNNNGNIDDSTGYSGVQQRG